MNIFAELKDLVLASRACGSNLRREIGLALTSSPRTSADLRRLLPPLGKATTPECLEEMAGNFPLQQVGGCLRV